MRAICSIGVSRGQIDPEVEAAQTPRAAAVNTNYAVSAGLDPTKDAILKENPKGLYVNLLAVRAADKDKPWVKTFAESYQTPEVTEFVLTKFKGSVLPAWRASAPT